MNAIFILVSIALEVSSMWETDRRPDGETHLLYNPGDIVATLYSNAQEGIVLSSRSTYLWKWRGSCDSILEDS